MGHKDRQGSTVLDFKKQEGNVSQALKQASHDSGLLKSGASRSAVTYVERDDPTRKHCELFIVTMNLSEQELQYPLDPASAEGIHTEDGRTLRRLCWDSAVNALCETLDEAGIRAKSLKNDRNSCQLNLHKEYIVPGQVQPDEFYALTMNYYSESELESKKLHYVRTVARLEQDIEDRTQRLYGKFVTRKTQKELTAEIEQLQTAKATFVASTPDPRELDAGLVIHVELSSPREYGTTRIKMTQAIAKFITALSRVSGGHVKLSTALTGYRLPGLRGRRPTIAQVSNVLHMSTAVTDDSTQDLVINDRPRHKSA